MERYDLMGTPTASSEEAGVLRIASEVDEKNCGCKDAAVTPSNLHNVLGSRKANTAYKGNEILACPYQPGLLLKCVQAGTTSTSPLDTTNVSVGQVITDGGVKWTIIVLPVELGGTGATTAANTRSNLNLRQQTFTALSELGLDYSAYLTTILNKMPVNSMLKFYASPSAASSSYMENLALPESGTLTIVKAANNTVPVVMMLDGIGGTRHYKAIFSDTTFFGWQEVVTVVKRVDGESGYIKYSNGEVEQWGRITINNIPTWGVNNTQPVFPVPHMNTNYSVTFTPNELCTVNWGCVQQRISARTNTSFNVNIVYAVDVSGGTIDTYSVDWRSKGRWR